MSAPPKGDATAIDDYDGRPPSPAGKYVWQTPTSWHNSAKLLRSHQAISDRLQVVESRLQLPHVQKGFDPDNLSDSLNSLVARINTIDGLFGISYTVANDQKKSCPAENCNWTTRRTGKLYTHFRYEPGAGHRALAAVLNHLECLGCGRKFDRYRPLSAHEKTHGIGLDKRNHKSMLGQYLPFFDAADIWQGVHDDKDTAEASAKEETRPIFVLARALKQLAADEDHKASQALLAMTFTATTPSDTAPLLPEVPSTPWRKRTRTVVAEADQVSVHTEPRKKRVRRRMNRRDHGTRRMPQAQAEVEGEGAEVEVEAEAEANSEEPGTIECFQDGKIVVKDRASAANKWWKNLDPRYRIGTPDY